MVSIRRTQFSRFDFIVRDGHGGMIEQIGHRPLCAQVGKLGVVAQHAAQGSRRQHHFWTEWGAIKEIEQWTRAGHIRLD